MIKKTEKLVITFYTTTAAMAMEGRQMFYCVAEYDQQGAELDCG